MSTPEVANLLFVQKRPTLLDKLQTSAKNVKAPKDLVASWTVTKSAIIQHPKTERGRTVYRSLVGADCDELRKNPPNKTDLDQFLFQNFAETNTGRFGWKRANLFFETKDGVIALTVKDGSLSMPIGADGVFQHVEVFADEEGFILLEGKTDGNALEIGVNVTFKTPQSSDNCVAEIYLQDSGNVEGKVAKAASSPPGAVAGGCGAASQGNLLLILLAGAIFAAQSKPKANRSALSISNTFA